MTLDLLAEDDINRRRALEPGSFIVEAPAGAGKTELLTQRYLRLLAIADEPEEIVAITFTNKAAGEMRQRIAESLERARGGVAPEAAHKRVTFELARAALARSAARDWRIEAQPGRLRLVHAGAKLRQQGGLAVGSRQRQQGRERQVLEQQDAEGEPRVRAREFHLVTELAQHDRGGRHRERAADDDGGAGVDAEGESHAAECQAT